VAKLDSSAKFFTLVVLDSSLKAVVVFRDNGFRRQNVSSAGSPNPHLLGDCGLNLLIFTSPLEGNFGRRWCFQASSTIKLEAESPKSPFDTPDSLAILRTVSTKVRVHCLATNETRTIPAAEDLL
jgi:hypothetical protein